jgi:hypothetical protein
MKPVTGGEATSSTRRAFRGVGDSAQGTISRGTWETRQGGKDNPTPTARGPFRPPEGVSYYAQIRVLGWSVCEAGSRELSVHACDDTHSGEPDVGQSVSAV